MSRLKILLCCSLLYAQIGLAGPGKKTMENDVSSRPKMVQGVFVGMETGSHIVSSKTALTLGYFIYDNLTIEVEGSVKGVNNADYYYRESSIGAKYFFTETFYIDSAFSEATRVYNQDAVTGERQSGIFSSISDTQLLISQESINLDIAVGNWIQYESGFYWGLELIGMTIPLIVSSEVSVSDSDGVEISSDDNSGSYEPYKTSFYFLGLRAGWQF